MIDATLDNLLEVIVTSERYTLYLEVISYLESIEYDTIQDELLNFAFSSIADDRERIEKPESTIADEIHAHLMQCLASHLRQGGIETTDEATLKQRLELAVGVAHIPTYEDLGSVMAATYVDDTTTQKLAEVLHVVTTIPTVHWTDILESVSDDLIKKIQQLSTGLISEEYAEVDRLNEYLLKLRIYKEFAESIGRELIFFKLVENDRIGRLFEDYINTGILTDFFEGSQMDLLALEIYGMALMSSDARNDPPTAIRNIIEKYLTDTNRTVKLNTEVTAVNGNFVKYFQTASNGLTS